MSYITKEYMLKDRRILMEQEIAKLIKHCGKMYIAAMRSTPTEDQLKIYTASIEKLSIMRTELSIINDMIASGNE